MTQCCMLLYAAQIYIIIVTSKKIAIYQEIMQYEILT